MQAPTNYGLSENYWNSLDSEQQGWYHLVRPLPEAAYTVDWPLNSLEQTLSSIEADMRDVGGTFELIPDFQRGHVWTDAQRSAYIESLIRKTVTARILFNCPGWVSTGQVGDIAQNTFQCIDGLQRLSAVRKFMAGEIRVFGGKTAEDLRGSPFDPSRPTYQLKVGIYQFTSRSDLLRFYLDLNAGGTVHASEELDRVRGLLSVALQQHP